MSIFSSIRKSRQQAKEHNTKLAEQKKQEGDKVVYKHVPTHAAVDAYASAPPSWREADRPRIAEQNRRRSAMAASGHHMNMPGIPRVGSSLSHVSFPTDDTSPMVRMRMPRAYSYNGVSPYVPYPDRSRDVLHSVPDLSYQQPASLKGKEVSRTPGSETPRISPTSSKGEHSPSRSESGSTSSQDGLEMKNGHAATSSTAAAERAHRLHPSHSRHTSDASAMGAPASTQSRRDSRPPPSTRGFASIPPAKALAVPNMSSDASSSGSTNSNLAGNSASRQSSTVSLPGLTPASSRAAHSNPTTPAAVPMAQPEFPLNATVVALPSPDAELPSPSPLIEGVTPTFVTPGKFKDRRVSKTTRFTELERIDSNVEPTYFDHPQSQPPPAAVLQPEIVNVFPEPVAEVAAAPTKSKSKSKKLTKGGGKLVKKSRAVAV